jgi:hypothetical protein
VPVPVGTVVSTARLVDHSVGITLAFCPMCLKYFSYPAMITSPVCLSCLAPCKEAPVLPCRRCSLPDHIRERVGCEEESSPPETRRMGIMFLLPSCLQLGSLLDFFLLLSGIKIMPPPPPCPASPNLVCNRHNISKILPILK